MLDEVLDELKNPCARCWNPEVVGTLVSRIHNKVGWALARESRDPLQAFYQITVTRLFNPFVVPRIKIR